MQCSVITTTTSSPNTSHFGEHCCGRLSHGRQTNAHALANEYLDTYVVYTCAFIRGLFFLYFRVHRVRKRRGIDDRVCGGGRTEDRPCFVFRISISHDCCPNQLHTRTTTNLSLLRRDFWSVPAYEHNDVRGNDVTSRVVWQCWAIRSTMPRTAATTKTRCRRCRRFQR